jgi:nicotinate phosphoribosyltransferase
VPAPEEVHRVGLGLVTDLYELTMAASYLRRGMTRSATFSLFVRSLPADRGFLVAAGIDDALDRLADLRFDADELAWLGEQGFDRGAVDALGRLRFTGDVWAVPEGRVVLPGEPLLEVTAPLPEAQLAETLLLNQVTYQTALATKAARCVLAADGRASVVDFALRRTHGLEAGLAFARVSAMVGFTGTSNVDAARRLGVPAVGTMAHSYIEAFPTEREAFTAFAVDFPDRTTFLVDTYDTLDGVRTAVQVMDHLGLTDSLAVRLDSGDLLGLARAARRLLDEAGRPEVRIVASGGLDEHDIARLLDGGAPIDLFGVGTRIGVSADAPTLDSAYKLVEYDGRPVMKLSTGKDTLPGAKQVHRGELADGDVLARRDEPAPSGRVPLLAPVVRQGRRLAAPDTLARCRERVAADLADLPAGARRLVRPEAIPVHLSPALAELTARTRAQVTKPD